MGNPTHDSAPPPAAPPSGGGRRRQRRPDLDTVFTINPDGSRNFIHLADVSGRWQKRKTLIWWLLIAIYAGLPWVRVAGRPVIEIDLPNRHAFLFGQTFTNQDFYLMFFLLTGMGFALFVATSLWGRVWCGYACPHTVFLEAVFRKIERIIEGSRETRMRRAARPAGPGKVVRLAVRHLLYAAAAFVIAHIFLSYFIPTSRLFDVIREGPEGHWVVFGWTMFWTFLLYFDNAWFREQTCLVICPYGRFQSALIDSDTVVIGYDRTRGEPRSPRTDTGGDCVDCGRCIAVCPTGIDIRNGLQMECVGCANCIDACDEIMTRLHRPTGLVRYDSGRALAGGGRRGLLRPRVALYLLLGLAGLTVATLTMSRRSSFEAGVLRTTGLPYTIEAGEIRNLYTLHVQNKGAEESTFTLGASTPPGAPEPRFIIAQPRITLAGLGDARVPIFASLPRDAYRAPFPLELSVRNETRGEVKTIEVRFRGP